MKFDTKNEMNKKLTCHREIVDFQLIFFCRWSSFGGIMNKIESDHSMKMVGMFQKMKFNLKSQFYKGFSTH